MKIIEVKVSDTLNMRKWKVYVRLEEIYFSDNLTLSPSLIVGVVLFNHSDKDFPVKIGDRIAQLIIEKITETECLEVE